MADPTPGLGRTGDAGWERQLRGCHDLGSIEEAVEGALSLGTLFKSGGVFGLLPAMLVATSPVLAVALLSKD